jgi:hypothetical protein
VLVLFEYCAPWPWVRKKKWNFSWSGIWWIKFLLEHCPTRWSAVWLFTREGFPHLHVWYSNHSQFDSEYLQAKIHRSFDLITCYDGIKVKVSRLTTQLTVKFAPSWKPTCYNIIELIISIVISDVCLLLCFWSPLDPSLTQVHSSLYWAWDEYACLDSLDRHLLTSTTRVTEFQLRTLVSMLEWRLDAWASENFFSPDVVQERLQDSNRRETRYTRSSSTRKIYKLCAIFFGYPQIILLTPPARYRTFSPERNMIAQHSNSGFPVNVEPCISLNVEPYISRNNS